MKRFVYASSCSVYGYTVEELCDETAPAVCEYSPRMRFDLIVNTMYKKELAASKDASG